MYSTSRVTSSSSVSVASSVACAGMVSSFVAAGRWAALDSSLQVAIHEVELLQPAQALADVLRADLAHALDRLELGVGGGEQLVEAAELADDLRDDQLRQPRDAPEDAVAARRDRVVERVQLAVVAEQLGQPAEVEQVLVGEAPDLLERGGERLVGVARRGSRARAPPSRRRCRPSSPRAASRSAGPRCRARRCSARSRPPCASPAPSAAAPSARRAASSPPSNSSAVRRVETWSRRVRYLSSVASAWLALASTTGMSSRMYLTPST